MKAELMAKRIQSNESRLAVAVGRVWWLSEETQVRFFSVSLPRSLAPHTSGILRRQHERAWTAHNQRNRGPNE